MTNPRYAIKTLRSPVEGELRTLCGSEYVVIPVVALVEGVRHAGGSPSPELVLAEAFGRHVETWNGRPIVVNHPINADGVAVLASSPEILESSYLGTLMGAKVDAGKLVVEAWLDVEAIQASTSNGVSEMWKRLVDGEVVEVSVGAIVYTKRGEGKYEGKKYSGVWDIVIPDHLAFLDGGQIGACSVEDGCGTFRIQSVGQVRLSEGARRNMAAAIKTVRGGGTEPASAPAPASVLLSKPVGTGVDEPSVREACACQKGLVAGQDESVTRSVGESFARILWNAETFDHDRRAAMQRAVAESFKYAYVVTYNDVSVVIEMMVGDKYKFFEVAYTSDGNNGVTFEGDPVEVVLQSKTVPIGGKKEGKGKSMSKALQSLAAKGKKADEEDDMEDDAEDSKGKKKKMHSLPDHIVALASALDAAETADDIVKALSGTQPGKHMAEALKVRDAVREQSVKIIQASSGGRHFTAEMLADMPFQALQQTAIAFLAADKKAAAEAARHAAESEETEEGDEEAEIEGDEEMEDEEGEEQDGSVASLSSIIDLEGQADRLNRPVAKKKKLTGGTVARLAAPGKPTNYSGRAATGGHRVAGRVPPPPDVFPIGAAATGKAKA